MAVIANHPMRSTAPHSPKSRSKAHHKHRPSRCPSSQASQIASLPCASSLGPVEAVDKLAVPPEIVLSPPLPAAGIFARSNSFGIMIEQDSSSIFDNFVDADADNSETYNRYNTYYSPVTVHLRHSSPLRYGRKSLNNHFRRHTRRHGRRLDDLASAPILALNDKPISEPSQSLPTLPVTTKRFADAEMPPNPSSVFHPSMSGLGLSDGPNISTFGRDLMPSGLLSRRRAADPALPTMIPLIPLSLPEQFVSISGACSSASGYSSGPNSPIPDVTLIASPAFSSAPNSPNPDSTNHWGAQGDSHNTASAANHPNAIAAALATVSAVVGVSFIGWLVWHLLRRRKIQQRRLTLKGFSISPDSRGGGPQDREKGTHQSQSPSISLPDQFWKTAATPILPHVQMPGAWSGLPDKGAEPEQLEHNSVDSCSIHSSFTSSNCASTDDDLRASFRSSSSANTSWHSTVVSGGEKFALVNGCSQARRSRSYTASFAEEAGRHRSRTRSTTSARSFGASLRSLKKPTAEELLKMLAPAPAKPPRSSLRPLTQLLYSSDLAFMGSTESLPRRASMSAEMPAKRSSVMSRAKARQSEMSIYSHYTYGTPDPAIDYRASQHVSRPDSGFIDPSYACDHQELTDTYASSNVAYYRSITKAVEDDLQTNYAASIISNDANQRKLFRASVCTLEFEGKDDYLQPSRRHTMAIAFPSPPGSQMEFFEGPQALTSEDSHALLAKEADIASQMHTILSTASNGPESLPILAERLPLTRQTLQNRPELLSSRPSESDLSSDSGRRTSTVAASLASLENTQIATARRALIGGNTAATLRPIRKHQSVLHDESTDDEVSDIWKLAQARVRARNSMASAMTSSSR